MSPRSTQLALRLSTALALVASCATPSEDKEDDTDLPDSDDTDVPETDDTDPPETDDTEPPETDDTTLALLGTCLSPIETWIPDTSLGTGELREVRGCITVDEGEACPDVTSSLSATDRSDLWRSCYSHEPLCLTSFEARYEETVDTGGDTSDRLPPPGDRCCYTYIGEDVNFDCGRPFVVEGVARRAPIIASEAWTTPTDAPVPHAAAAARWRDDAAAEHASVAAFARLALHLLHHGAPAHLLADTAAALTDEVRHAQAAFAVLAVLTGRAEGPGPLPTDLGPTPSLRDLAVATAVEGGVGESLAAGIAAARLAHATHPLVRTTLQHVVVDEARHADLAWRIVDWAVQQGGVDVARAVDDAVREAVTRARRNGPPVEPAVPHLGLPGPQALHSAWHAVLDALEPEPAVA